MWPSHPAIGASPPCGPYRLRCAAGGRRRGVLPRPFFKGPAQARIAHFDYTRSDVTYGDDLAALVRLVAAGRLHPEVGSVRDRSRTADVIKDLRARQVRGKAVLTVR
ncbi:zinc-binding dehydrogenase [Streptomyces sp. NPDC058092]|uniref:zinc-binding dehydrogenase n=1 Tax=Streptomyces sp. NPDC058092 TaxID=3346336 RepID=UPI0036E02CD4